MGQWDTETNLPDHKSASCTVGGFEANWETYQETGANEHSDILRSGLKCNTDEHDKQTDHDGQSSASPICEVWGDWNSNNWTNRHDGIEKTQSRGIWLDCSRKNQLTLDSLNSQRSLKLTVVVPVFDGLETVHHGPIETVGCWYQDDSGEEEVELPQSRLLVPCDLRELPTTDDIARALSGSDCASCTHFVLWIEDGKRRGKRRRWLILSEEFHGPGKLMKPSEACIYIHAHGEGVPRREAAGEGKELVGSTWRRGRVTIASSSTSTVHDRVTY